MESYPVYCNNVAVGNVVLENAGLYYRVICQCNPTERMLYKLFALCGSERVNIGICMPLESGIGLDKKMPRKRFDLRNITFCLVSQAETNAEKFFPLVMDEPFDALDQLETARFSIRDGAKGLLLDQQIHR